MSDFFDTVEFIKAKIAEIDNIGKLVFPPALANEESILQANYIYADPVFGEKLVKTWRFEIGETTQRPHSAGRTGYKLLDKNLVIVGFITALRGKAVYKEMERMSMAIMDKIAALVKLDTDEIYTLNEVSAGRIELVEFSGIQCWSREIIIPIKERRLSSV